MDIQHVIDELKHNGIIKSRIVEYRRLKGGTSSEVYLLDIQGENYIVKFNDPTVIKEEANYLHYYQDIKMLPDLLLVESSRCYLVYSYIEGTSEYNGKNKREVLQSLVRYMLNYYKFAPKEKGWGWTDSPSNSWREFQMNEISVASTVIASRLSEEDHQLVHSVAKESSLEDKKYLLHGDCGFHNFIFNDDQLSGVIDPTPVIGDPVYDLVYAFCSSTDDLTKETIDAAASCLSTSVIRENELYEQVIIALYIRLETCLTYHPDEFEVYLKAWYHWRDIVKSKTSSDM